MRGSKSRSTLGGKICAKEDVKLGQECIYMYGLNVTTYWAGHVWLDY